ncbi:hypothetical protein NQ314_020449 [Rhamnusium bicolor]|uniref:Uncharacterized protein n=1 Tax=Rhamnusium bicolor TaxID=1586634 RepID=A0AAV8WKX7_9CUCU|nr:hypothetical protein NQ314_020449 [Rhamnusium bicolor]
MISTPPIGDTIKKLTNQLMDVNSTSLDMVYDVRTPPKVKQQQQQIKMKLKEELENSHAGIAIPVDEDTLDMEETTKKLNFYKIERPTTNSGLSTWILLSGQKPMTTRPPPTRKPVIKQNSEEKLKQNVTVVANDKPNKVIKPIFKKRATTTTKPTTTTAKPSTTTVKDVKEINKLIKVKASVLNNAVNKKNITSPASISAKKPVTITSTTTTEKIITSLSTKTNATLQNSTITTANSETLPVEAKEGEVELSSTTDKKKKTTSKRKKNKTRRRKPSEKDTNSTTVSKPNKTQKEKPIGTQFYNYLSREIMPTVGVGLVGLMVTAGLASYFLYPFGVARRSYDIDRKDKDGSYYYNDEYSGGMPEEEAIGKVIAGMPSNSLFGNNYKTPSSRNTYPNIKYRLSDRRAQIQPQLYGGLQGSVEDVPLTPKQQEQNVGYDQSQSYQTNSYEPISYTNDLGSRYSLNDKKFVVGNIPKEIAEEVTPVAVPEHGPRNFNLEEKNAEEPTFLVNKKPKEVSENVKSDNKRAYGPRSLKIRKKRSSMSNELDNEINSSFDKDREEVSTIGNLGTEAEKEITTLLTDVPLSSTTSPKSQTTTDEIPTTTIGLPEKVASFIDLMKELVHFKARIGLQVIQNVTQSISKYISRVQARLDQHYRNYSKSKN